MRHPPARCYPFHSDGLESSELPNCPSLRSEVSKGDPTGLLAGLVSALSFCASGKVNGGFVLFVTVNVLEVDHHVQGVGEDEQQDQRRDEAHEDGRREERAAVAG